MNREELLQASKPILFNADMVRAILDSRKTATRRIIKPQPKMILCYAFAGHGCGKWGYPDKNAYQYWGDKYKRTSELTQEDEKRMWTPPYHTDDVLYVRETWDYLEGWKIGDPGIEGKYFYKADGDLRPVSWRGNWKPSIHMPKEAARIFLKVKDVRVERLQEITEEQVYEEGFRFKPPCLSLVSADGHYCDLDGPCTSSIKYCDMSMGELFGKELWDYTIKKSDLDRYGWDANPWVWVIEFERIEADE